MKTSIPNLPTGDVLVYKYGCRLDVDCLPVVNEQISLARKLYNDLVANMRQAVDARSERELELCGEPALAVKRRINDLNAAFDAARAANDEVEMKAVAEARRSEWKVLSDVLKTVRSTHKVELRAYLSGIGKNSTCSTYQIRSAYVAQGLGWATANQVLDSALQAFQSTIKKGQAPRFAIGAEITRDTLSLQFTTAGGVDANALLSGDHNEFKLTAPDKGYGRRCYGSFSMRMGAAKAKAWATGTWQAHRPVPDGAFVAGVTLVREKVGTKFAWNIQLLLKLATPRTAPTNKDRRPLAAIHLGWSADSSGRRIGAISSASDAGLASLIQLPASIEPQLERASEIKARRGMARDAIVTVLKAIEPGNMGGWPEELQVEFKALRRLPAQHIAASRLHRFWWMLHNADIVNEALTPFSLWRQKDRLDHQAEVGLARSARNQRKDFYRTLALRQCQQYEAIVLDMPNLQDAAQKVDEKTGERNALGRSARSGRVVAALHEYIAALSWAAARCQTTLIEVDGSTASVCSSCGAVGLTTVDDTQHQQQECPSCGSIHDRKCNAAAVVYQHMCGHIDELAVQAAEQAAERAASQAEQKRMRLMKVQESRRQRIASENPEQRALEA